MKIIAGLFALASWIAAGIFAANVYALIVLALLQLDPSIESTIGSLIWAVIFSLAAQIVRRDFAITKSDDS